LRRRALTVLVPLAGLLVVGSGACVGALPANGDDAGTGTGAADGAIAGAGGGAGLTAGQSGAAGRASGGSGVGPQGFGGASGRATGGAVVGSGGIGGAPKTGVGGSAAAGSGGSGPGGVGPVRLVIFYTRWGTSYPEWLPTGADRNFTLGPILAPLAPFQHYLIPVDGLTNANVYTDGSGVVLRGANANDMGDAMVSLLTAAPAPIGGPASGPSFDTVIGTRPGALGPPLRLAVGQFGFDDNPGICFDAKGVALRGEGDPNAVAMRLFGHTARSPTGDIDSDYPLLGAAQIGNAAEALARGLTDTVVLMWGDHVDPKWLGLSQDVHTLSHLTSGAYTALSAPMPPSSPTGQFQTLQTWYATQFRNLLQELSVIPVGATSLLDQSVVIWISESGTGSDHQGYFIPVVIAGGGGGRLDIWKYIDLETHPVPASDLQVVTRTQGDLFAALARLWGIPTFGDPAITRQPMLELLKP